MKIYIVKDKTGKIIGSRKKKFFVSIAHIKTAKLWDKILTKEYTVIYYDLNKIDPQILII